MSAQEYTPPLDPELALWVADLDDDAMEVFQERAAIREHLGGLGRDEAEKQAWAETQLYLERRNARRP